MFLVRWLAAARKDSGDGPGVVVSEPVGGLELRQRVLVELEFVTRLPRTRQLQLIEDAELHDASRTQPYVLGQCSAGKTLVQPGAYSRKRKRLALPA
jgi:hypothetical protein